MDQSSGHVKQFPNALNSDSMNLRFVGAQPKMHNTIVKEVGPYPRKLNVGDIHQMSFTEDDIGPFYFSDYEQQRCRFNCLTGQQKTLFKTKKMIKFYCKDEGWLYKPKGSLIASLILLRR